MIAIVAMSPQRVIGDAGRIPWHISEDLKFFKRTTLGHSVLMGRKTFDSIGKPLPGRDNLVLSRSAEIAGVRMVRSLDEIQDPADGRELFVIGGAELYGALLPRCDTILLTRVTIDVHGDTFFPPFENEFDEGEILETGANYEIRRHCRLP